MNSSEISSEAEWVNCQRCAHAMQLWERLYFVGAALAAKRLEFAAKAAPTDRSIHLRENRFHLVRQTRRVHPNSALAS